MANVITLQPNLAMRYSAGKLSEEDLIKPDNITDHNEPSVVTSPRNPEAASEGSAGYKEETFCDYIVSICHCSSWLCANLISSMVLCFENCIDFAHTCKCNNLCCDVCGGSEDSLDQEVKEERNNDLNESGNYDDEYIVCEYIHDIEEELPDSCVIVERRRMETDGEKLKESDNQEQTENKEDKKKSWI